MPTPADTCGHGERITRRQEQAIAALLSCPSQSAAAAAAGVCERTLCRWRRQPDFAAAYAEAKQQAVTAAIVAVQQAALAAVETLRAVMTDTDAPHGARVTAARTVLEMAMAAHEQETLEARIAALEAAVNSGAGRFAA